MTQSEKQILDVLKELKEVYGIFAVKAEFEAEGARMDELIRLRDLVLRADLGFVTKIGGCEAIHDMNQCKTLGATGIMAPMIETPFAMRKFAQAAERVYGNDTSEVEWIINAETWTCLSNFDEILNVGAAFLNSVTVGRSDLSASMNIARANIECDEVFQATRTLLEKSASAGLTTNFGGNIGIESIPFIQRLNGIASRFETRKVVLRMDDNSDRLRRAISKALEFELLYLLNKRELYTAMSQEDNARILRMQRQLGK